MNINHIQLSQWGFKKKRTSAAILISKKEVLKRLSLQVQPLKFGAVF